MTVKLLLNSFLATPKARCALIDIKDFYLNNKIPSYEYMKLDLSIIPEQIIDQYNLLNIAYNKSIYIEIQKGIYGLPQAGKIAHDELKKHLATFGYAPCQLTPELWKHNKRPISFLLVVDDFAVKYIGK